MVYQGEREMAVHNRLLGKFDLIGIPAAPRGIPQIEVTFDIDANGIIKVTAKDLGTGKEQQVRIESSSGLNEAEIQKMVKDAEANAARDKAEREKIDLKNHADQLIYQTEKTMGEMGDKISQDEKDKIKAAINDLREKIKKEDIEGIKAATDALMKASHKMAEELYKNARRGRRAKPDPEQRDHKALASSKVGPRKAGQRVKMTARKTARLMLISK